MTFGEEIKYLRSVLYLTQAEMASLMSVTEQTIRRWEGWQGYASPFGKAKVARGLPKKQN